MYSKLSSAMKKYISFSEFSYELLLSYASKRTLVSRRFSLTKMVFDYGKEAHFNNCSVNPNHHLAQNATFLSRMSTITKTSYSNGNLCSPKFNFIHENYLLPDNSSPFFQAIWPWPKFSTTILKDTPSNPLNVKQNHTVWQRTALHSTISSFTNFSNSCKICSPFQKFPVNSICLLLWKTTLLSSCRT